MELLIRRNSKTSPDPVKDKMLYKKGDIVVVKPDGHEWGRMEDPALHPDGVDGCGFVIVKVPGVTATPEKIAKWLGTIKDIDGTMTKRRFWEVMTDDVPANIRNKLRDNGVVTITWTNLKNYIRNKLTEEREV